MDELPAVVITPVLRVHLLVALRPHVREFARNGHEIPGELAALLAVLEPQPERDALARRRELAAQRSRRYRARRKAAAVEVVDQSA